MNEQTTVDYYGTPALVLDEATMSTIRQVSLTEHKHYSISKAYAYRPGRQAWLDYGKMLNRYSILTGESGRSVRDYDAHIVQFNNQWLLVPERRREYLLSDKAAALDFILAN